jgi:hypothetical protein
MRGPQGAGEAVGPITGSAGRPHEQDGAERPEQHERRGDHERQTHAGGHRASA